MEIGWPPGVPFVHPHDLPNKAKIGFLEAYEPGWSITHDMELSLIEPGHSSQHTDYVTLISRSALGHDVLVAFVNDVTEEGAVALIVEEKIL
ncbi:hypothetical protein AKJ16_DCAP14739 [Drosera capensis]